MNADELKTFLMQHVPSLSVANENTIWERLNDIETDAADLALRTCRCGAEIDGFYSFIDHLITVAGGESHLAN